jgi:hypothetical protein
VAAALPSSNAKAAAAALRRLTCVRLLIRHRRSVTGGRRYCAAPAGGGAGALCRVRSPLAGLAGSRGFPRPPDHPKLSRHLAGLPGVFARQVAARVLVRRGGQVNQQPGVSPARLQPGGTGQGWTRSPREPGRRGARNRRAYSRASAADRSPPCPAPLGPAVPTTASLPRAEARPRSAVAVGRRVASPDLPLEVRANQNPSRTPARHSRPFLPDRRFRRSSGWCFPGRFGQRGEHQNAGPVSAVRAVRRRPAAGMRDWS